jgi:hypothetical protein
MMEQNVLTGDDSMLFGWEWRNYLDAKVSLAVYADPLLFAKPWATQSKPLQCLGYAASNPSTRLNWTQNIHMYIEFLKQEVIVYLTILYYYYRNGLPLLLKLWLTICWHWMSKSHTSKGIGCPGRHGPKNAARISLLRDEARRGLQANHQRITNVLVWRRTG